MTASLRALLSNVIDYAGLFPPAKLPLDRSYRNYRDYLGGADRWMLGQFICPIDQLPALCDLVRTDPPGERIPCSVLGPAGDDTPGRVHQLAAAGSERMTPAAQWLRLSAIEQPTTPETIPLQLAQTDAASAAPEVPVFFEIAWTGDWRARWTAAAEAVNRLESSATVGLKLRTGGVTADAFPSPEVVAGVIHTCRTARVKLKFTAGLHHPIRRFHDSVGTKMHGFLNVFVAGVLAHVHGMDEHGIRLILESESPDDFAFDEYGLSWKTLRAANPRIEQVRRNGLMSLGSCSFDEPRDDLRALRWM